MKKILLQIEKKNQKKKQNTDICDSFPIFKQYNILYNKKET